MTYQQILDSSVLLPPLLTNPHMDGSSRALFGGLLQMNPNMRLGMLRNGIDDLWTHPFFKSEQLI
jgi:hypothetical protein